MSSFKGMHEYSVDVKGRINIPARLRKYVSSDANDTFVITRGMDQCLFIYPLDEWNKLEQTIRALNPSDPKGRYFMRTFLQYATESQLDGQSRISIPKELLQLAAIDKDVLILGVLEHIEVWNPAVYKEYQNQQQDTYENVAQSVLKK